MERYVYYLPVSGFDTELHPSVYLVFVIWDTFEVLMIYFFIVETKGLTLEEIDEVFAQPNPVKYSTEHRFGFTGNHPVAA